MKPYSLYKRAFSLIDFNMVDEAITWEQRDAPRSEAYYAEQNVPYTYGSGRGIRTYLPMTDWPKLLRWIQFRVEWSLHEQFELLFCNRYADEHQHLGWHADDSESIDHNRPIPIVSFGETREIFIRENGRLGEYDKIELEHGDMLVMHAGMQQTHQHRIPKGSRIMTPRISFTFRGLAPAAINCTDKRHCV